MRFGFKIWMLCSDNGYWYAIKIYSGKVKKEAMFPLDQELYRNIYPILKIWKNMKYSLIVFLHLINLWQIYQTKILKQLSQFKILEQDNVFCNHQNNHSNERGEVWFSVWWEKFISAGGTIFQFLLKHWIAMLINLVLRQNNFAVKTESK